MKHYRTIILVGAIALIATAALAANVSVKNSAKTEESRITIGAAIPQTGFGAYWGAPVAKGIRLAEKELREKFPNKNFRVIIEDSQSSPSAAVSAAQKMLAVDKADGLYSEFSGMSAAISPVAKAAGKIFVYSTFNQKIADDNETSAKTFTSFEAACDKLGDHLAGSDKKVMIVSSIGDTAPYCARSLKKHLPESGVRTIDGFVGTDFRTLLLQNKDFAPDYIIPIMYEDGSFALIKQNHELKLKASFYCYKQDCVTDKILRELPHTATNGIIYFEMPIDSEFIKKIQAEYPGISNDDIQAAANSYQSIMAMGESLAACSDKSAACSTKEIRSMKLKHPGYRGAVFNNRILSSEITLNIVMNGKGTPIQ